ncbi:Oxidoreductase AgnL4 [Aspergillus wentii]
MLYILRIRIKYAKINAFCRNKAKLIEKVPRVDGNKRVQVYQNSTYDIDLLSECICNTRAIFHVVTTNDTIPNCHVGLDPAKSII